MTHDEFLALLGHELRGPIGAITAAAEVIRSSAPSGADAIEARDVVQRQAERMGRALDGLVELGRLVAHGVRAKQRVNLANLLREVRGVSVAPDTIDAWIETDGALLEDALAQLAALGPMRARIAHGGNETAGVLTIEPVAGGLAVQFVRALLECANANVRVDSGAEGRRLVAELPR